MTMNVNRRTFIKTTAAAGASFAFLPHALSGEEEKADKSRVVEVSAPGVVNENNRTDDARVQTMVDKGMLSLTGEKDLAAAWRRFVKPDDVVGIKLNNGGGQRFIRTEKGVLQAVLNGVRMAGVPDANIIVWDQVEEWLVKGYAKRLGFRIKEGGVRFKGCAPSLGTEHYMEGKPLEGFATEPVKFAWGEAKVAELVANELTAVINLPVLKDHACSGVTLALKNISHAVVNAPWNFHGDSCDPYIADIVNIPSVRDKLRLHILDGIFGVAEGGPQLQSLSHMFVKEEILLSTDPVALDTIGREWIVQARKDKGFPPMEEAENKIPGVKGRVPKHIETAAARGLGTNDSEKIELVKVDVTEEAEEEGSDSEAG